MKRWTMRDNSITHETFGRIKVCFFQILNTTLFGGSCYFFQSTFHIYAYRLTRLSQNAIQKCYRACYKGKGRKVAMSIQNVIVTASQGWRPFCPRTTVNKGTCIWSDRDLVRVTNQRIFNLQRGKGCPPHSPASYLQLTKPLCSHFNLIKISSSDKNKRRAR